MYLTNSLAAPLLPHATDLQPYGYLQHYTLAQQPFNYGGLRATNSQWNGISHSNFSSRPSEHNRHEGG
jgi:hypothetical protein